MKKKNQHYACGNVALIAATPEGRKDGTPGKRAWRSRLNVRGATSVTAEWATSDVGTAKLTFVILARRSDTRG